jgi:hypothetical protein
MIPSNVPALIVWETLMRAEIRLSEREPLFGAKIAYQGMLTRACTDDERSYFALNTVQFRGVTRIDGTTPVFDAHETMSGRAGGAYQRRFQYRMFYADPDHKPVLVRNRFELHVDVVLDASHDVAWLKCASFRLVGDPSDLCVREFPRVHSVAASSLHGRSRGRRREEAVAMPSLMFTPALFDLTTVAMPWYKTPRTRRQCKVVWQRLRSVASEDSSMYTKAKAQFDLEYERKIAKLFDERGGT